MFVGNEADGGEPFGTDRWRMRAALDVAVGVPDAERLVALSEMVDSIARLVVLVNSLNDLRAIALYAPGGGILRRDASGLLLAK